MKMNKYVDIHAILFDEGIVKDLELINIIINVEVIII
jgi:hypothetical protein